MNRRLLAKLGRAIVVDVSPLRLYPEFRVYFASRLLFDAGRQLIIVALPLQIFAATGSSLAVGLIGAVQLVPSLGIALVGGSLADAIDRRRLLIIGQTLTAITFFGLAAYAFSARGSVWPVYLLAALSAGAASVVQPTRQAVLPSLVDVENLAPALGLQQVLANVTKAGVPAAGGLLVATTGLAFTYIVAAVLSLLGGAVIRSMRSLPPLGGGTSFGLDSVREGLRYVRGNRLIWSTLVVDLNAMVFGMPSALFPAMGVTVFAGDATTVGLLYSAPGVGALIAALSSGWIKFVRRQGVAVVVSVTAWGVAIAAFGLTNSLALALLMLGVAGAADVVSAVFRNSIVQLTVPDALRGRISSIHIATVSSGPRLGDLEAGVVAAVTSTQVSVVSGGLACAIGTLLIARRIPELPGFRLDDSTRTQD